MMHSTRPSWQLNNERLKTYLERIDYDRSPCYYTAVPKRFAVGAFADSAF